MSVNNPEDKEDDVVEPSDFTLFLSFDFLFKNVFIYLWVAGLSCGTQDLCCIKWAVSL